SLGSRKIRLAPAAFGLVSFLLVEGLERARVRHHLLVFSSAAPLTAMLTFYAIVAIGSESLSSSLSTGILMLFSAGTFLYVATVHVLPELVGYHSGKIGGFHLPIHSGGGPAFTLKELGAIILGAVLPAILASGHSH
uniref:ZIP family metal transporter n=1 Tax=Parascaris equorum TaxID=6256 RepID=A0A914R8B2_PAREQ